ncbi:type II restriction endonuclease [Phyllobacterium brassicacearum]|uniref:Type II restriction endonuclease n=1 Tax=Phyllobacterium brassicacearum TaxID=314235 RepID=A0A2P7BQ48_9HYPH|nr:type II restriction endonuclease [Phyllobacterium brassicacearum]PSH68591.1 type II restriction endonuclease [Phyllobacterium brassicacearum]TDQ24140.1 EcoRII-like protein [Phyllobacterium brassicacearum]
MKQGSLSDYFVGVGAKVLKGTEVDRKVSRGHEFQGVSDFRAFLGSPATKTVLPVSYVWLSDEEVPERIDLTGTWYDSRQKKDHRDPEYRLYYPKQVESVVYRAKEGDTLFLCQPKSGSLLALMCAHGSSIEQQLLWLFGLQLTADFEIVQQDLRKTTGRGLDFTSRYILELIGIEVVSTADQWLDRLLKKFGEKFPGTREFSTFARNAARGIDALADPDLALVEWMDLEERLFMTLEKHIVSRRLEQGFMLDGKADVDAFVGFSLSVQNRRKSRAGYALGNHIEEILRLHAIRHKREATTEKRNGPDFLFPDEAAYHDPEWPTTDLIMLGAKTTCRDRWRQVLAEADRIEIKHLLTLEPGISETQTDEMQKARLQLVLPAAMHETYRPRQREWLMNVGNFLSLVKERQMSDWNSCRSNR